MEEARYDIDCQFGKATNCHRPSPVTYGYDSVAQLTTVDDGELLKGTSLKHRLPRQQGLLETKMGSVYWFPWSADVQKIIH